MIKKIGSCNLLLDVTEGKVFLNGQEGKTEDRGKNKSNQISIFFHVVDGIQDDVVLGFPPMRQYGMNMNNEEGFLEIGNVRMHYPKLNHIKALEDIMVWDSSCQKVKVEIEKTDENIEY